VQDRTKKIYACRVGGIVALHCSPGSPFASEAGASGDSRGQRLKREKSYKVGGQWAAFECRPSPGKQSFSLMQGRDEGNPRASRTRRALEGDPGWCCCYKNGGIGSVRISRSKRIAEALARICQARQAAPKNSGAKASSRPARRRQSHTPSPTEFPPPRTHQIA